MVHGGVRPEPAGGATERLSLLGRLGRGAARRKWWVLAAWVLVVVAIGVGLDDSPAAACATRSRSPAPTPSRRSTSSTPSSRQQNLPTAQVVFHLPLGPAARDDRHRRGGRGREAPERGVGVEAARLDRRRDRAAHRHLLGAVRRHPQGRVRPSSRPRPRPSTGARTSRSSYGGQVVDLLDQQSSASDHSDEIGLVVALVIMIISFGSVIAALLPLVIAVLGVGAATGLLDVFAERLHHRDDRPDPRGDDRPRGRDRLLAVHRHPVPSEPRRRARGRARGVARDRDRRVRRCSSPA